MVEQVSKQESKQGGFREVGREDYRVSSGACRNVIDIANIDKLSAKRW